MKVATLGGLLVTFLLAGLPIRSALASPIGSPAAEDGDGGRSAVSDWMQQPIAVQWRDLAADVALVELSTRLGQPVWASAAASRQARETRISLLVKHLNGFQAVCLLCRMADLEWVAVDNVIAVTVAKRTPISWRSGARALRSRVLRAHPEWGRARVGNAAADLDLLDVTVESAMSRLSEAYGVDLWAPQRVWASQTLITLRGKGIPRSRALALLAEQVGVRAVEADGAIGLVPKSSGTVRTRPASIEGKGVPTFADGDASGKWITLKERNVSAEGWAEDIEAVRQWHRQTTKTASSSPAGPDTESRR
jgi:hypothetical protein